MGIDVPEGKLMQRCLEGPARALYKAGSSCNAMQCQPHRQAPKNPPLADILLVWPQHVISTRHMVHCAGILMFGLSSTREVSARLFWLSEDAIQLAFNLGGCFLLHAVVPAL